MIGARTNTPLRYPTTLVLTLLLMVSVAASGCTQVQLIARYDEETVQAVKSLLTNIDKFLIQMERVLATNGPNAEEAGYEKYTSFYDDVYLGISVIRAHAASVPKNQRTQEQIDSFEKIIKEFEAQHRQGLSLAYVSTARKLIDTALLSILQAEAAKPRR